MRTVVVSGIGLVSPIGCSISAYWDALVWGRSGIRQITRFDASGYNCAIGGQVDDSVVDGFLDPRALRTTPHVSKLALAATELAVQDAHWRIGDIDPDRVGVCVGTAMAGLREGEQQYGILLERGLQRVNPFIVSGSPSHGIGAELAAKINARGPHFTFGSGCPSSLQAISHAASLVASSEIDLCVAGGAESPLLATTFSALGRTHELSTLVENPTRASRPFDRDHSGLVLSEGACFVVLEPLDQATKRGVTPYGEILGSATSCDAAGMYGLDHTGLTGAKALHRALIRSSLGLTDINYVCAHANSSIAFDRKEVAVLNVALGEIAPTIPVSSIKGVLGHPFGASGAFQTAASLLAIRHQLIPPNHNLESVDPHCNLDCVQQTARPSRVTSALVTSYGYGGINAYLVVRSTAN